MKFWWRVSITVVPSQRRCITSYYNFWHFNNPLTIRTPISPTQARIGHIGNRYWKQIALDSKYVIKYVGIVFRRKEHSWGLPPTVKKPPTSVRIESVITDTKPNTRVTGIGRSFSFSLGPPEFQDWPCFPYEPSLRRGFSQQASSTHPKMQCFSSLLAIIRWH